MVGRILDKLLDRASETIVISLVFSLPLYLSFFYRDIPNPLIYVAIDRSAALQIGVVLLVLATFLRLLALRRLDMGIKRKQAYFFIPVAIMVIIATILSIDRHTSFWGSYYRQQGLVTHIFYWLLFLLLLINIDTRKKLERLVGAILIASFLVSIFGILEWFGINLLLRSSSAAPFGRVSSSFGQPVFLGNYLLLTIFLCLYKLFISEKFLIKVWWSMVFAAEFVCLLFTYTRGAWLGLLSGILFGSCLYLYLYKRHFLKPAVMILFISLMIAAGSGLSFYFNHRYDEVQIKGLSLTGRIASIIDFKTGSNALRLKYWQGAVREITVKPILGNGPETQHLIYVNYYDKADMLQEKLGSIVDRAHNQYLDILLQGGLFVLAAYALAYLYLARAGIVFLKNPDNQDDRWLAFFLLVGLAAHFIALLFSFTVVETSTYLYLYAATLLLLFNRFSRYPLLDLTDLKKGYFYALLYSGAVLALFTYLVINDRIYGIRADYHFVLAKNQAAKRLYPEMLNNYLLATTLNPREEVYRDSFLIDSAGANIISLTRSALGADRKIGEAEFLTDIARQDEGLQANFYRDYRRAIYLGATSGKKDGDNYKAAVSIYQRLVRTNPYLVDLYKNWSLLYANNGDYDKAINTLRLVFDFLPDINNPDMNMIRRHELSVYLADAHELMATYYCRAGDQSECEKYYLSALKFNPYQASVRGRLGDLYHRQGRPNLAIAQLDKAAQLEPWNWQWPYELATFLWEKKDTTMALKQAERAHQLYSENKQVIELLNMIKQAKPPL